MAKKTTKKITGAKPQAEQKNVGATNTGRTHNRHSAVREFFAKILLILIQPDRFFKKIVVDGNLNEAMVKAAMFGLIGGVATLTLALVAGQTLAFWAFFTKLVIFPLVAVIILFVFAGLMMLFSEISGGSRDWELAVKGISSIFFMYPVILVINSLAFSCWSLWAISMVVDGYILFLLYNIAIYCMGADKRKVTFIIAGVAALLFLLYFSGFDGTAWLAIKNPAAAARCF